MKDEGGRMKAWLREWNHSPQIATLSSFRLHPSSFIKSADVASWRGLCLGRGLREGDGDKEQCGEGQSDGEQHGQHGLYLSSSRRVTIDEEARRRDRRDGDEQCAEDDDVGFYE